MHPSSLVRLWDKWPHQLQWHHCHLKTLWYAMGRCGHWWTSPLFCFTGGDSPGIWTQDSERRKSKLLLIDSYFVQNSTAFLHCLSLTAWFGIWIFLKDLSLQQSWILHWRKAFWQLLRNCALVSTISLFAYSQYLLFSMYCACLYLAAVAERFAPTAAANLYCHSDAGQQSTPHGDLIGTHEMMVYAAILLAPLLVWCLCKGISSLASPISCIWCAAIEEYLCFLQFRPQCNQQHACCQYHEEYWPGLKSCKYRLTNFLQISWTSLYLKEQVKKWVKWKLD